MESCTLWHILTLSRQDKHFDTSNRFLRRAVAENGVIFNVFNLYVYQNLKKSVIYCYTKIYPKGSPIYLKYLTGSLIVVEKKLIELLLIQSPNFVDLRLSVEKLRGTLMGHLAYVYRCV